MVAAHTGYFTVSETADHVMLSVGLRNFVSFYKQDYNLFVLMNLNTSTEHDDFFLIDATLFLGKLIAKLTLKKIFIFKLNCACRGGCTG